MFARLNAWLSGTDEAFVSQHKATEWGKWLTPQEALGVQCQGDFEIVLKLIEERKSAGMQPYWYERTA